MHASLSWWRKLLPIVVVPKKNNKFRIYMDFQQLNVATKKDSYHLSCIEKVLDEIVGHKIYSFLDGFFSYHHIMIAFEDKYKVTFIIKWGAFV
jgi:hypothetical protein